ncbi:hypothetical protein [Geobacillus kaustophilus]|uniref:hypothetical protein n=1 Tax=Geobacillus kaustophilus TaxID=1462 RepID=UPI0018CEE97E|nr:hypothetical protein [Geobacillus kaustophilus]
MKETPFRCSEPVSERRFLFALRLMMGMAIAACRMMPAGLIPICISYRCNLKFYHFQLLSTVGRPNNAASRSIYRPVKQVVVRSSVTLWRDGASLWLAFDSRKWSNRFSVKDMLNFFVASIQLLLPSRSRGER